MANGTILFFNPEKDWGFVQDHAVGAQFFVHINNCVGIATLRKGDCVSFDVRPSPKSGRLQATNVRLLEQ
jgi:CspA family cold shock protein